MQYKYCIWNTTVNGNTALCDCIKALNFDNQYSASSSSSKIAINLKTSPEFFVDDINYSVVACKIQRTIQGFANSPLAELFLNSVWQPPDLS